MILNITLIAQNECKGVNNDNVKIKAVIKYAQFRSQNTWLNKDSFNNFVENSIKNIQHIIKYNANLKKSRTNI